MAEFSTELKVRETATTVDSKNGNDIGTKIKRQQGALNIMFGRAFMQRLEEQ